MGSNLGSKHKLRVPLKKNSPVVSISSAGFNLIRFRSHRSLKASKLILGILDRKSYNKILTRIYKTLTTSRQVRNKLQSKEISMLSKLKTQRINN